MKFGTGSTTELTQKREGQSTKMPYVRPYIYTNKLVCLSTNGERDTYRGKNEKIGDVYLYICLDVRMSFCTLTLAFLC